MGVSRSEQVVDSPIQEPNRQVFVKSRDPRIYSGGLRPTPRLPEPLTFLPAESASEDPKLLVTAAVTQQKWEALRARE